MAACGVSCLRFEENECLRHALDAQSSDEEPPSTNSTLTHSIDTCVYSSTPEMVADGFHMTIGSIACEGEAIAGLVARLGTHVQRYSQILVGMHSSLRELAKKCAECDHKSVKQPSVNSYAPNGVRRTKKYSTGRAAWALPDQARQTAPYSQLSHKSRRAKTAVTTAKRPLSDFNFFCRDARKLVVEAHPEFTKEQVNKELGRIWSSLDGVSRQHYRQMYIQDKMRYSRDILALAARSSNAGRMTEGERSTEATNARLDGMAYAGDIRTTQNTSAGGVAQNSTSTGTGIDYKEAEEQQHPDTHTKNERLGNALQRILNSSASPSALGVMDDPEDVDEPLAHTLLRPAHLPQPVCGLLATTDQQQGFKSDVV
ncbi:high mobility group [Coemansia sp. RSA 1200]|nr:high mobility group [Coemansia sp. RSA 1200]